MQFLPAQPEGSSAFGTAAVDRCCVEGGGHLVPSGVAAESADLHEPVDGTGRIRLGAAEDDKVTFAVDSPGSWYGGTGQRRS